jgi:hypothetical protein
MWPPESGLLSLGRGLGGFANDDGRHLPALPSLPGRFSTGKSFQVVFRALATVGWVTPISSATARSDFSGVVAIATAARLPAGT